MLQQTQPNRIFNLNIDFKDPHAENCKLCIDPQQSYRPAMREAGPMDTDYEHIDAVELLHEVSHTARLIIGDKPVTIMDAYSACPVIIRSDRAKLLQIMTGIMNNSAKFTNRGRITLILNKDDDRIRMTVVDTGRGMTAEQINVLFASSDHVNDAEIRGSTTSGCGLRTVKGLLGLLNGSISISSKAGEGTIVEVTLPFVPQAKSAGSCETMRQENNRRSAAGHHNRPHWHEKRHRSDGNCLLSVAIG